ncbi:MAG: thrombospondin type-1 domain-containing protein [Bdellovibrio sp.]|nr:thrombospondin type-1 domain-containing protein [Bdellovibrio sp.]
MLYLKKVMPAATFVLVCVVGILAFQNCSPQVFTVAESASTDLSGVSAVKIAAPGLCQSSGSLEFILNFEDSYKYECFDGTRQTKPVGALCTSGPAVVNFVLSPTAAQDCSQLKVCGISPREVSEIVSEASGVRRFKYKYDNLPMGCAGQLKVTKKAVVASATGVPTTQNIPIDIPLASCRVCGDGITKTCGTCPATATPTHGGWSAWVNQGLCSRTCGGGLQNQTRTCTNPAPANGGAACTGPSSQQIACNTHACPTTQPVNGGWSPWVDQSACSKTCGGGTKTQARTCSNPYPANGGANCSGPTTQQVSCNSQACAGVVLIFSKTPDGPAAPAFSVGEMLYGRVTGVGANNGYSCMDIVGSTNNCVSVANFTKMPNSDWYFDGAQWRGSLRLGAEWANKTFKGYWHNSTTVQTGSAQFSVAAVAVNGICGSVANTCAVGSVIPQGDSNSNGYIQSTWTCQGQNGGANSGTCSATKFYVTPGEHCDVAGNWGWRTRTQTCPAGMYPVHPNEVGGCPAGYTTSTTETDRDFRTLQIWDGSYYPSYVSFATAGMGCWRKGAGIPAADEMCSLICKPGAPKRVWTCQRMAYYSGGNDSQDPSSGPSSTCVCRDNFGSNRMIESLPATGACQVPND